MAIQPIDIGTSETSGDGESIRSAFNKINNNFASFRNGYTGSQGDFGFTGSQGETGYVGSASTEVGYTGSQGDDGLQGDIGFTGSQGTIGYTGSKGEIGNTGFQGYTGSHGYAGSQGNNGSRGFTGYTGSTGDIGITGYTGSQGDAGTIGHTGSVGYTGSFGTIGHTGSAGYTGSTGTNGYTGSKGDTGYVGSHGYTGSQGIGYTGSAGTNGYTGSKGDTGYVGSHGYTGSQGVGFTGSSGTTGFTGSTGPAATVGTLNYVQNSQATSTSMSASPSLPFTVISAPAITTNGSPVQIIVTGDANPISGSGYCLMRLFRGSTAVGQVVQAESTTANVNVPYCIQFVDAVAAGTYTYSMKVVSGSGSFNFGEATGPVITVTELQNVIGNRGYTGSSGTNGVIGYNGSIGYTGSAGTNGYTGSKGDTGYVGSQGPSGQGLINQTIILNAVAPSPGAYTAQDVTQWSASYTGTGGQLLITADVTAYTSGTGARNYYLKKNGTIVVTGVFYFNSANTHMTLPALRYVDTTGSTSAATWSITVGSGLTSDTQDRATITVTEYTGFTSITTTGNLSGNTLISTNAVGNEGGEVDLAKSPNSTLSGSIVVIDQYADRIRFFEAGGTTRGVYIDLAQGAGAGVGTLLNNRVAAFANAGTFVTMDNIKATVTTGGQRGLSLATVSGTITCYISGTYGMNGASGGTSGGVALTTTASTSIFGWSFFSEGDTATYIVNYGYTKSYRITVQIGGSYNNNMISIERLI
jgi:hypothetical protein